MITSVGEAEGGEDSEGGSSEEDVGSEEASEEEVVVVPSDSEAKVSMVAFIMCLSNFKLAHHVV